jgi:hypothetical protein|tara:strand:+ start:799 stop:1314 length:516 start_codon:yes stop_codon:yes gene_type:complete
MANNMPTGLKATSAHIAIGFSIDESAANTFTQGSTDLNLSPLDYEVFVVTSINMDPTPPDNLGAIDTRVRTSLTTTSQTAAQDLSNTNCLASADIFSRGDALGAWMFHSQAEQPPATLEYLGIIATNDFFVQIIGDANLSSKKVTGKLYGYRARATAAIYSALVQSEVLSA